MVQIRAAMSGRDKIVLQSLAHDNGAIGGLRESVNIGGKANTADFFAAARVVGIECCIQLLSPFFCGECTGTGRQTKEHGGEYVTFSAHGDLLFYCFALIQPIRDRVTLLQAVRGHVWLRCMQAIGSYAENLTGLALALSVKAHTKASTIFFYRNMLS